MSDIEFVNLGADDYDRAKKVLNKAKHPGFVGRELFYRCATSGVCCIAILEGVDCGVAMIAKEKLQALSIISSVQGKGVGSALMRRLQPKWVNAIAERVSFFEHLGYKSFGAPKVGQNGKHATQLMERGEIPAASDGAPSNVVPIRREEPETSPATFLADLADETPETRLLAQLQLLDSMLEKAVMAENHTAVLQLTERANIILANLDRVRSTRSAE